MIPLGLTTRTWVAPSGVDYRSTPSGRFIEVIRTIPHYLKQEFPKDDPNLARKWAYFQHRTNEWLGTFTWRKRGEMPILDIPEHIYERMQDLSPSGGEKCLSQK